MCDSELAEDPIEEVEDVEDDPVSDADSEKTLDATILDRAAVGRLTFVDTLESSLEESIDAHEGGENQDRNVRPRLE